MRIAADFAEQHPNVEVHLVNRMENVPKGVYAASTSFKRNDRKKKIKRTQF